MQTENSSDVVRFSLCALVARRKLRAGILLVALFGVFLGVGAALAATTYGIGNTNPGGSHATLGWNNRDWNRACRDSAHGVTGKMSVQNYYSNGLLAGDSGTLSTNCVDGIIVGLEDNGYFRDWCYNNGTVTFPVVCQWQ